MRRLLNGFSWTHTSPVSWPYCVCIKKARYSRCFWIKHAHSSKGSLFPAFLSLTMSLSRFPWTTRPLGKSHSSRCAFSTADGHCGSILCSFVFNIELRVYSVTLTYIQFDPWGVHPISQNRNIHSRSQQNCTKDFWVMHGIPFPLERKTRRKARKRKSFSSWLTTPSSAWQVSVKMLHEGYTLP